ncbi:Mitochondrial Carrier (MC) Family [Phytophthora cinnamomi]|uniref:Mitochondrial Carrier (MC) Family n=1 Tax=Phytophthora cinnamomi TaxID=4785 RepID=UPI00355A7EC5|nr:Mitochondrial Carrier (MC) Family [Phytophthora cinnamomi]
MAGDGSSTPSNQLPTLLGSASAGMIGRVFCHPLDTVKARLQASTASGQTIASHLNLRAFSLQHLRGLYRGLGVSMLGSAPATCLYLTSYEVSKDTLMGVEGFRASPSLLYLGAGMAAEALSCVLWVPIDVIKERMQVQVQSSAASGAARKVYYHNTLDAVQTIARTERLGGLYKGYIATLLSFGPFSALYFMFYEKAKAFAQKRLEVEELPAHYTLVSAAAAGATASFLTNPLDLIKLRLQVQRAYATEGTPAAYRGIVDGLTQVIKTEGVLALYKGAGARVAFHAPSTAITMSLFESCRRVFASLLDA